ncbi:MAG: Smr/MutS family protein [Gemmatimonadales bacterium]
MIDEQPLSVHHGVSAGGTAGTPLPFSASTWESDTLDTLEFAAVLDRVARYAAGPLAAARIKARRPSIDAGAIGDALRTVDQAATLVRSGEGLTIDAAPDANSVLKRLQLDGSVLEATELVPVRRLLAVARSAAAELRRVRDQAPRVAALLQPLPDASLARKLDVTVDHDGRLLDSASPALASARKAVHQARGGLIKKLESLLRAVGDEGGSVTIRGGRYVIPVRRDNRHRPAGIVHDESASQGTLFIEPTAVVELGNTLREAELAEERATLKVLRDVTAELRPHHAELMSALEMCVAADELQARAAYAAHVDGHCPVVGNAGATRASPLRCGTLAIRDGRHPLLLDGDTPVVPFSLVLDADERTVLVSGPNTGGKTVLLKAVGLFSALAQSGIIPPVGPKSSLPLFRSCFADIGDHQSIAASLSTFAAHLNALRHILEVAGPDSLVLIDEMGSGTDPAEGAALAGAALSALTRRGVTTVATTHLGALKQLPERLPAVVNGSLQFDALSLEPTYRFQKGVPGRSYGLAIGLRLGLDPAVLAEAEADLPDVERHLDILLAAVEEREQDVARSEATLAEQRADIELRGQRATEREVALAGRAEALDNRERQVERDARTRTKAYLLEARRRVEQALGVARAAVDEATAREARRLVEEGVQAEAEALAGTERGADKAPLLDEPVVVGSRVRLASGVVGEVIERRRDGRWVITVGGGTVRTVVRSKEIVVVVQRKDAASRPAMRERRPVATEAPSLEIDLRGMTGDEAQAATVAAVDGAVVSEQPYLRIIHGMGTGVVRDRVRQVLDGDSRVLHCKFAERRDGGTGVTIVEFRS